MSDAERSAPLWMPLNISDYLRDTQHLDTLEHGAYFLLLMHCWTTGGELPNDPKRLARIAKISPHQWKKISESVMDFFKLKGGVFRHKRIDAELAKADELIEKKRAAGRKSAAARAERVLSRRSTDVGTGVPTEGVTEGATEAQQNGNQSQSQYSVDKSTGTDGAKIAEDDPVKTLFDDGVRLLTAAGTSEKSARSLIGRWRSQVGDDEVALGLVAAEAEHLTNPVEWLMKRFAGRSARTGPSSERSRLIDIALAEVARQKKVSSG